MKTIKYSKLQAMSRTKNGIPYYKGKKLLRSDVWYEIIYRVLILKDFNHSILLDLKQLTYRLKWGSFSP